ncbi:cytochrome-c oxidase, cbb3-type subunit III [Hydrogenophilus thermoluteolus]|uniref:Cbb3-type cytochrome c oxidase subunit n=1 Tax=Hydrogenophilus thermoluteolus TaxID=297 RepID=A0A2Z6DX35_HYDTE|nr:cytochrome-c oxidase, cbb3-type subunit III [Hydrogenophilus thermoluteolus]HCO78113.1 cytochrome-c oxidase, cbb3-type subunit III [Rhodocyclaceae bacterium]MBW7657111.1 cytochrome-c oxidase, cbb3-type subunit III [Hydrogenophilus thermoluteolus]BBD76898.1 cytochrome c oxidase, cbb3-type subunit III [Hydrogenophilus thermoluteolus]HNQ48006.1 cytochrome-c oxidase, cbb3-type subunit III [Hydrogenophilus thermoluteolus]HNU20164.1 cytochrome-c oxidase, cbb3-type subunit III [Hydrogenophilus the
MADFISPFWDMYVKVLVALSLLFCVFVIATNMRATGKVGELQPHSWDENLQEWNNPLPRWWMYLFWLTVIFAIVYLVIYPGFGSFKGIAGWSSVGQWEKEMKAAEEKYGPLYAKYRNMDVKAIAADPEAMGMGKRLFQTYCMQCHGADARGAKGFPNLTDNDWLGGDGSPDYIKATITNGRMGVMPPFPQLGEEGAKNVAHYVRSLSGLAHDATRAQLGSKIFAENCAACHGPDGKGNPVIGAPNLTDNIWLYSSSETQIMSNVMNGLNNRMPAFGEFLGQDKVHLLTAYVWSLSHK